MGTVIDKRYQRKGIHFEGEASLNKVAGSSTILVIALILMDLFTKNLATNFLREKPSVSLIPGVLELQYLENRGAAFGIMQNGQFFFSLVAIVAIVAILYFRYLTPRTRYYRPLRVLLLFIIAGAMGNLIDRLTLNYVRDFIYFSLIDFPIFNVADIYVSVATFLLVILLLFYYKDDEDFAYLKNIKKTR